MRSRITLYLTVLVVLAFLMAGCQRPAAPDVTATPDTGVGGQVTTQPSDVTTTPPVDVPTPIATETSEPTEPTPEPTLLPTDVPTPVSPAEPTPAPTAEPTPVPTAQPTPQPTLQPGGGETVYVVQDGDNLFRIALKYNLDYNYLARYNGITNPAMIYVGQKIKIPPAAMPTPAPGGGATTYTVKAGDNLFRIALRYNMSYLYLAQYNGIPAPYIVYVGQVIKIPQP